MTSWRDLAFTLNEDDASRIAAAWHWLAPDWQRLLLCSMIGGMFVERSDGSVFWLESGTGLIEPAAPNAAEFDDLMRSQGTGFTDEVWEWFMPPLIEQLHKAGKIPQAGQCYGFTILPVFKEGIYEPTNMFVVSALEWLAASADMHCQLKNVSEGGRVEMKVVP